MLLHVCLLSLLSLATAPAQAAEPVEITNAWVRATVPGQEVGAAYMDLESKLDLTMTHVESSATTSVEIHEMSMKNGVMKMRMLETLELHAGTPVKLAPGGFHLMLFDLKQPLQTGKTVLFTLHFKDKRGEPSTVKVAAPVKNSND